MTAYPELVETPGARLERWVAERHVAAVAAVAREPDAVRFLGAPATEEGQMAAARRNQDHWERFGFGRWAIVPDGGAPVGWAGAFHPLWHPERHGEIEVGWGLAGPARGRGLATAGARAAIAAVFEVLGAAEVIAFVDPENHASRAVAIRAGMEPAGRDADPDSGDPLEVYAARNGAWTPPA